MEKQIKSALISVFSKDGLEPIVKELNNLGVTIYSTGGTQSFIEGLGVDVKPVEGLTSYPSILGGRVKTLHPKVFGGILARRDNEQDIKELAEYDIPEIDLVIVDLYPFEDTVKSGADEQSIIEKIDIGGVSLIRAAAKNHKDTAIVANMAEYSHLLELLKNNDGKLTFEERKELARRAFGHTAHYDREISMWFNGGAKKLRYGENPHQEGYFMGDLDAMFTQLNGKELSYNNLVDIDAAVNIINDFDDLTFTVIKHTNPCGLATRSTSLQAWKDALAGDPISAFGGIIATNRPIDLATAEEMNKLFFEVLIAPEYAPEALELLKGKKNRILLQSKDTTTLPVLDRTILNGTIRQDKDTKIVTKEELKTVTKIAPTDAEIEDLLFADVVAKHTKSNTIVLIKDKQLLGIGCGQTSRVDALKQAIIKAEAFGFDLNGAVMASDAFFPFPDCVEIAGNAGIKAVIQPGGSIKDQDSIDYCDANNMSMVFTGFRHFKH